MKTSRVNKVFCHCVRTAQPPSSPPCARPSQPSLTSSLGAPGGLHSHHATLSMPLAANQQPPRMRDWSMPQPQRQPVIYATSGHYLQGMNPPLKKATHVQLPRCGECLLWLMDLWSAFTLRHLRSNHKSIRVKWMSSTAVILNVVKWTAYVRASCHLMIYVNVTYTTDLGRRQAHTIHNTGKLLLS